MNSMQLIEKLSARVAELENVAKSLPPKAKPDATPARAEQARDIALLQDYDLSSTSESAMTQPGENGQLVPSAAGSYRRAAFQYSIAF